MVKYTVSKKALKQINFGASNELMKSTKGLKQILIKEYVLNSKLLT
jgi:hypothetical protein